MAELCVEDLVVWIAVDDAEAAQEAGARFARALAGAVWPDFALALAEQGGLIRRALTDVGFADGRARLAADRFEAAAWAEWRQLAGAGAGGGTAGRA